MIQPVILIFLSFIFNASLISFQVYGQASYRNYEDLSSALKSLNSQYPELTTLHSIAKTLGQKDIWVLEIGSGDVDDHPGLAVVGGVDGRYISGPELSLRFAEKLLRSSSVDSIRYLIDSVTFYIIPNVSPDATEQFFKPLKYDRQKNSRATDDDRDGRLNEDPYEDLNNDGYITSLRIKDPKGSWIKHAKDNRVMILADKNKGEKGEYLLVTEGVDNDRDKEFNEDGEGGIIFNKNMPFKFEHFKPGAGDYPVSEVESKAVLDYLYDKWNIFAVFTFGPSDNLSVPQQYIKADAEQQIISSILKEDAVLNAYVSSKYNELCGEQKNSTQVSTNGGFMQWAYFHYGRLSYSTPAFFIPEIKVEEDSLKINEKKKDEFNSEVNFLLWADSIIQDNYFLDWTFIEHPDFTGKEVEIGGLYPHIRHNPPIHLLDSIADAHHAFIIWLAAQRPVIDLINLRSEHLGENLYRIELDVYNKGYLPALSGIGENTRWVKKPKVSLTLQEGQEMISGRTVQLLDKLPGDAAHHMSWLIKEKGTVRIEAGAPQTGIRHVEFELK
jgi:hypothetical protein